MSARKEKQSIPRVPLRREPILLILLLVRGSGIAGGQVGPEDEAEICHHPVLRRRGVLPELIGSHLMADHATGPGIRSRGSLSGYDVSLDRIGQRAVGWRVGGQE